MKKKTIKWKALKCKKSAKDDYTETNQLQNQTTA
jgi:hypothetical protein